MLVFLLSTVQQSTILTQLDVDVAGRFHLVVQTAPIESAASPLVPHFSTPFHTVPRIKVPISSPANRQLSSAVAARAHTVHNLLPTYEQSPSWTAAPHGLSVAAAHYSPAAQKPHLCAQQLILRVNAAAVGDGISPETPHLLLSHTQTHIRRARLARALTAVAAASLLLLEHARSRSAPPSCDTPKCQHINLSAATQAHIRQG